VSFAWITTSPFFGEHQGSLILRDEGGELPYPERTFGHCEAN
jgi:hypothetical protein